MAKSLIKQRIKTILLLINSVILKTILVTIMAFAFSCALYLLLGDNLKYIGVDSSNYSYFQDYYENRNESELDTIYRNSVNDSIFILKIDESTNRGTLADVIEMICNNYQPKVVGIDVLFKQNNDTISNKRLKDVVKKHADKIVLAQLLINDGGNDILKENLFTGDTLRYGIINFNDYFNYTPKYQISNKDYYDFAYEISRMYKHEAKLNIDFNQFVVNYAKTSFEYRDILNFIGATEEMRTSFIKGKIVLIGAMDNHFDNHYAPFLIEGSKWLSGIKFHAYAICSLVDSENQALRRLPILSSANIFIYIILCFLYSLTFVLLNNKDVISKILYRKIDGLLFELIRPLILIIVTITISLICYSFYTKNNNIVPNLVLFLISIYLINTFNGFILRLFNSKIMKKILFIFILALCGMPQFVKAQPHSKTYKITGLEGANKVKIMKNEINSEWRDAASFTKVSDPDSLRIGTKIVLDGKYYLYCKSFPDNVSVFDAVNKPKPKTDNIGAAHGIETAQGEEEVKDTIRFCFITTQGEWRDMIIQEDDSLEAMVVNHSSSETLYAYVYWVLGDETFPMSQYLETPVCVLLPNQDNIIVFKDIVPIIKKQMDSIIKISYIKNPPQISEFDEDSSAEMLFDIQRKKGFSIVEKEIKIRL